MNTSIVGAGAIGSALATRFAHAGIDVTIATRRGPDALAPLIEANRHHVTAVSLAEALRADIVILAVPFGAVPDVVGDVGDWSGRIVVDTTNAIDFPAFTPTDLGGRLSSDVIAEVVPGARVVKAFNTLPAAVLAADPSLGVGRRVLFLSGNDRDANAAVASLIERLGFAAINLGRLDGGGVLQQFGAPLVLQKLVKQS